MWNVLGDDLTEKCNGFQLPLTVPEFEFFPTAGIRNSEGRGNSVLGYFTVYLQNVNKPSASEIKMENMRVFELVGKQETMISLGGHECYIRRLKKCVERWTEVINA